MTEISTATPEGADAARVRTPELKSGMASSKPESDFPERFERDIGRHVMEVIRDDGIYRHLRFRRPGTMCMHFDLLTWPGYLCYTGDMGTFVFSRVRDMIEFFRRPDAERKYPISFGYWAEKVQASDKCDGIEEFSIDTFRSDVEEHFESATEEWNEAPKTDLWQAISDEVLCAADEYEAVAALREFQHGAFYFRDWERSCKEYTYRFLWCCHALPWAIRVYDARTQAAPAVQATASSHDSADQITGE